MNTVLDLSKYCSNIWYCNNISKYNKSSSEYELEIKNMFTNKRAPQVNFVFGAICEVNLLISDRNFFYLRSISSPIEEIKYL